MARRDKLISIQQRENEKDQLMKMYRARYFGTSAGDTLADGIITGEVNRFIASAAPITEANLQRLDRRLQGRIFRGCADTDTSSVRSVSVYTTGSNRAAVVNSGASVDGRCGMDVESVSAYTAGSNPVPSVRSGSARNGSLAARGTGPSVKSVRAGPAPPGSLSARLGTPSAASREPVHSGNLSARGQSSRPGTGALSIAGDALCAASPHSGSAAIPVHELNQVLSGQAQTGLEWSVLDKVAAQLHKQETTLARRRELELKQKIKNDLDKQVADEKLKQEREKEADKQISLINEATNRLWSADQTKKDQHRIDMIEKQKRACQEQVRLTQQRRDEEKLRDRELDKKIMDQINMDLERDRKASEERMKKSQEDSRQALKDSSEASRQREEKQQSLALREKQSLEAYEAVQQQREEAKRLKDEQEREFRRKNERRAAGLEASVQMVADQSELKAVAERAAKERAADMADKAKQQKLHAMRHQNQSFLIEQIKEKQIRKAQDSEKAKQFARTLEEDNAKINAKEQEQQNIRRMINWEHRQELEKQMKSKEGMMASNECMSERELRLNKHLLEKVTLALTDISG